ncbi:MAG: hypothetical protein ABEJ30_00005 [Halorientalis sp.]
MSRAAAVCLAGLLALAGCAAPSGSPTSDVSVSVTNRADTTYEVRTAVVSDGFAALDVTYRNGTTRRVLASRMSDVPSAALVNAANVSVVGAEAARAERLAPGEGLATLYEDVPGNVSVLYVAWPPGADRIRTYGALSCAAGQHVEASVTLYPGNDDASVVCRG